MNFKFSHLSRRTCWFVLLILSLGLSLLLRLGHFPAAILLGCMFSAILISIRGATLIIPKWNFAIAQGVVGCLMARSLQPPVLIDAVHNWPIFVAVSLGVFSVSVGLGWVFMRQGIFPGSTAIWGLAPGAAAAMVMMSESYGADVRLVAFMQYLRVAIATTIAALVAHFFATPVDAPGISIPPQWFMVDARSLTMTLLAILVVVAFAYKLAIPGGAMILPLILATVLQFFGFLKIELPLSLLAAAYSVIGWSIGLRFNSAILRHAWKSLPKVLMAIGTLIVLSGLMAIGLWIFTDYDLFTAYLASSPGGADSVAVIAATTSVDVGFVMSMQLSRFLFVLLFGPMVSKFLATKSP